MARVLICEPVEETRVLIECVIRRMGHESVDLDALQEVDVLVYDPASRAGLALAQWLQAERPRVALVACRSAPSHPAEPLGPRPFASLLQPFVPGDLRRVLKAALPHRDPLPA